VIDPKTPVLVGASWLNVRDGDAEPIDMMTEASLGAAADSGGDILAFVRSVRVVKGFWRYKDPGRLVAERLGLDAVETVMTPFGGNEVYDLVGRTAQDIAAGRLDAAIVCAAEFGRTRRAASKAGVKPRRYEEPVDAAPDLVTGEEKELSNAVENAAGLMVPTFFYAMAETSLRHRRRESIDEHRLRVSELWASAAAVASDNPHAWLRDGATASDIGTVSESNRMVASPYTKLMTANVNVDQGASVIMCSAAVADAAGVPRDKWVFPYAATGAAEHWYPSERWALDESPAMRIAAERCLELADISVDDVDLLDLYSCFPSAVQLAQAGLAIDPSRPFTITGGLTFSGGPLNCYCIQALTRAIELLRERRTTAFLTGNGGFFTKHSCLVLGSSEPKSPFVVERPQAEVDALPRRRGSEQRSADGTVEAYTVIFGRAGAAESAIVAVIDDAGDRWFANTNDPDDLAEMLATDMVGASVSVERVSSPGEEIDKAVVTFRRLQQDPDRGSGEPQD